MGYCRVPFFLFSSVFFFGLDLSQLSCYQSENFVGKGQRRGKKRERGGVAMLRKGHEVGLVQLGCG